MAAQTSCKECPDNYSTKKLNSKSLSNCRGENYLNKKMKFMRS